jgi:hypothetical protein
MPGLFDLLMQREAEPTQSSDGPADMRSLLMQFLAPKNMIGLLPYQGSSDIDLPAESPMDPRLMGPDVGGALRKAFDTTNRYATGHGSALERLQKAGK